MGWNIQNEEIAARNVYERLSKNTHFDLKYANIQQSFQA